MTPPPSAEALRAAWGLVLVLAPGEAARLRRLLVLVHAVAVAEEARAAGEQPASLRRACDVVRRVDELDPRLGGQLAASRVFGGLVRLVRVAARGAGRPARGARAGSRWEAAAALFGAIGGGLACSPETIRREWRERGSLVDALGKLGAKVDRDFAKESLASCG